MKVLEQWGRKQNGLIHKSGFKEKLNYYVVLKNPSGKIFGRYEKKLFVIRACDEINCVILRRIFVHNQGVEIGA